jgi:hypothetical protein
VSGDLHALLIGIDQYIPRSGGISYPSLTGAVRDIRNVRDFLCGLPRPPVKIVERTASTGCGSEPTDPTEPRELWPTRGGMIDAFREVAAGAAPGDQVYIHYSGHGGRTPTRFPELNGPRGCDESLVPCDISDPSAAYLLDIEVAMLVQEMIDKGLFVTIVLDCCHAAGMRRGRKRFIARGLTHPDLTKRPFDDRVASREELLALRRPPQAQPGRRVRHFSLHGWLPDASGYVLLAACRPQESANEYPFVGEDAQGALTYCLLDTLRQGGGTQATWKEIHNRVLSRIRDEVPYQTPMLIGEGDRRFLSTEEEESVDGIRVTAVDGDLVLLGAGEAAGVRAGMRLTGSMGGNGQTTFEVCRVGATDCWARIESSTSSPEIREGAVFAPAAGTLREPAVVALGAEEDRAEAYERVRKALATNRFAALTLAESAEAAADFLVSINSKGFFEVASHQGPLLNLGTPLRAGDLGAESELLRRLVHLARYFDVLRLENQDGGPLRGRLKIEVLGVRPVTPFGGPGQLRLLSDQDPRQLIELRCGDHLELRIVNRWTLPLNVAVLDLQPDWGITQVFPTRKNADFWVLDPKEERDVNIRAFLPPGCEESTDVFKAFATVGPPNLRWLELPALTQPVRRTTRSGSSNLAEVELKHLSFGFAAQEWTTAQIEVRVRREG